jgi:hypothetical protein
MKRFLNIIALSLGILLNLSVIAYGLVNVSKAGDMTGVVVAKSNASLEVMDQAGAKGSISVAKVLAPGQSWIAVHLDDNGKPGKRIGLQAVPKGESTDVEVKLDDVKLTDKLIVAMHADQGVVGTFEFSMEKFDASPDKPYFVDGMELAMEVSVAKKPFGVKAGVGEASIQVSDQVVTNGTLTVTKAVAPTGAWIVVHLDDNGKPGKRVGYAQTVAGENTGVVVTLDPAIPLTGKLLVAVHADRGVAGTLEFDMMDKYNSPDQPFFVGGKEVAVAVSVK